MMKLGVNIDHVATVRQARGTAYPNPADMVPFCRAGGADSITVHLREDRRHIQDRDLEQLAEERLLPLNLEMALVEEMLGVAETVRPEEVCLVPEKREELTTEGGLDVAAMPGRTSEAVTRLKAAGIAVSLFIDPDAEQIDAAAASGAPVIELHTGTYCNASGHDREEEVARLVEGARRAHELGLRVNAGHGINLENLAGLFSVPHLDTLNIGHSIVARALFVGMAEAVREMKEAMAGYPGGPGNA